MGAASVKKCQDNEVVLEFARQNVLGGVVSRGIEEVRPPVHDPPYSGNNKILANSLQNLPIELVDNETTSIIESYFPEGSSLTAPNLWDVKCGRCISQTDEELLMYGDDFYVFWIDPHDKRKVARLKRTVDMRARILQLDRGLVRTETRVYLLPSLLSSASLVYEGEALDASLSDDVAKMAICTPGNLSIRDLESGNTVVDIAVPSGHHPWQGRSIQFENNVYLWTNGKSVATIDSRSKDINYINIKPNAHNIFNLHTFIRDICTPCVGGVDAFMLTHLNVEWVDMRLLQSVGGFKHYLVPYDPSLSMTVGNWQGAYAISVTSASAHYSTFYAFDRDEFGMLRSLKDPWMIETWPTIVPRSQVLLETEAGLDLWTAGADGGLYRQVLENVAPKRQLEHTEKSPDGAVRLKNLGLVSADAVEDSRTPRLDSQTQDSGRSDQEDPNPDPEKIVLSDWPPIDEPKPIYAGIVPADFDYRPKKNDAQVLDMRDVYLRIIESKKEYAVANKGAGCPTALSVLEYANLADFDASCRTMWIETLSEEASAVYGARRARAIKAMSDALSCVRFDVKTRDKILAYEPTRSQDLANEWPIDEEVLRMRTSSEPKRARAPDDDGLAASDSEKYPSTAPPPEPLAAPEPHVTLSQPVGRKAKKKKKTRRQDGFA